MNKFWLVLMSVVAVTFFTGLNIAQADDEMMAEEGMVMQEEAVSSEVINNVCPVMGNAVDNSTPFRVEYQGQTIGFCCAGCIEMFNADPEKYMSIIYEQNTVDTEIELPSE